MKKGVVLVLACFLVAVGWYVARPSSKSAQNDKTELARNAEQLVTSEAISSNGNLSPELDDLVADLDRELATEDEDISASRPQLPQRLEPEDVAEQTQLALQMGYIDEGQVPEFQRQRERLNAIIQEQQESEMGEAIEEGVSP
jgi:hypothetical protein